MGRKFKSYRYRSKKQHTFGIETMPAFITWLLTISSQSAASVRVAVEVRYEAVSKTGALGNVITTGA